MNISKGDSQVWEIPYRKYPFLKNPDVTLTVYLKQAGRKTISLPVNKKERFFSCELDTSVSRNLLIGQALVVGRAELGGFCKTFQIELLNVGPSIDDLEFDPRSQAEICLEQAEKALAEFTSSNGRVRSYTIGARSMTFNSYSDLISLVKYWKNQVYLERCRANGIDPRTHLVKFV